MYLGLYHSWILPLKAFEVSKRKKEGRCERKLQVDDEAVRIVHQFLSNISKQNIQDLHTEDQDEQVYHSNQFNMA